MGGTSPPFANSWICPWGPLWIWIYFSFVYGSIACCSLLPKRNEISSQRL